MTDAYRISAGYLLAIGRDIDNIEQGKQYPLPFHRASQEVIGGDTKAYSDTRKMLHSL